MLWDNWDVNYKQQVKLGMIFTVDLVNRYIVKTVQVFSKRLHTGVLFFLLCSLFCAINAFYERINREVARAFESPKSLSLFVWGEDTN